MSGMRDFIVLFVHAVVTMARRAGPGVLRSVVAESALLRHQLLILSRGRKRAPNLRATDRIIAGLTAQWRSSRRKCFERIARESWGCSTKGEGAAASENLIRLGMCCASLP